MWKAIVLMTVGMALSVLPTLGAYQEELTPKQDPAAVSLPEYIVICAFPKLDNYDGCPVIDMRIVLRAKNEVTAAYMVSTLLANLSLPDYIRRAVTVTVEPKKPEGDSKDPVNHGHGK